jgi:hypothetical protein
VQLEGVDVDFISMRRSERKEKSSGEKSFGNEKEYRVEQHQTFSWEVSAY